MCVWQQSHIRNPGVLTAHLRKQIWKVLTCHKNFWSWMFILGILKYCLNKGKHTIHIHFKLGKSLLWFTISKCESSLIPTTHVLVIPRQFKSHSGFKILRLEDAWMVSNAEKFIKSNWIVHWKLSYLPAHVHKVLDTCRSHTALRSARQGRWGSVTKDWLSEEGWSLWTFSLASRTLSSGSCFSPLISIITLLCLGFC